MAILALDQGTSGSKAIVVDDDGIHAIVEKPVTLNHISNDGVEHDPHELLASIVDAGREAIEQAGKPIDGVALANVGETVLAWDPETGDPLTPCINWMDKRSKDIVARLESKADRIHELTALVLDTYFAAPKLAWVRENLTTEGVVTMSDSWLVYQLTGEFVSDTSTASRSLLLDIDTVEWNDELLEIFGLQDEKMPRLVASDEIVGTTTLFGGEIPVGGLMVDQQAALLAECCLDPGDSKCTYGSGAFLFVNTGHEAHRFESGLTTSVAWTLRGKTSYCVDGQVYTAATAVRWMKDMGMISGVKEIDKEVAKDSGGVLCGPSFAGLAAPWWRSDAGAFLTGMKLATGKAEISRAILEGISAQVAELAGLIAAGVDTPLQRLKVDGGLTNSKVLMQIQSDLLQVPIDTYPSAHATALGAAAAMRLALNPDMSVEEGPYSWEPEATYEPKMSADDAAAFRKRWVAAVEANLEF